ncbi:exodeoxyribonuclease V subunit gamma [Zobellella maritima]|uniref:exodeoxyribonuclease V subunit gamma n=1 Tax=Zobellella maritima TaxID=2059725 RepID=UPI000E30A107|nr:exodeoxyribonuclease V subunit gamma [Zobellella maritima]
MFTLYHSNRLDVLRELMVSLIRMDPLEHPFESEVILVQNPGMAQWLKLELAGAFGIAANIEFPLPASFIWKMFAQTLEQVPEQSAFNKEAMVWKLMSLLPGLLAEDAFLPLRHYLADDQFGRRCYQLCGNIADIFDQYLVYRPEWIQDWEAGGSLRAEAHPWQPVLWRALVARTRELGQSPCHRANLFQSFIDTLAAGELRQPLPKRLFIFGISALPPKYLEALHALGQHTDVHLLLTNPCRYYWGDIQDNKRQVQRQLLQRVTERRRRLWSDPTADIGLLPAGAEPDQWFDEDGEPGQGNPLLASMGKQGRDHLWLLAELGPNEIDAFVELPDDKLLHRLQQDILELRNSAEPVLDKERLADSRHKTVIAADDDSLVIHSCYSPIRELEVLHDELLKAFEADPGLAPKDVVVMVPDINAYSPYIQAVFGAASGERFIPFSLSDRSAQQESPILLSFLAVLCLAHARCTLSELLEILEVPAVLARFELNPEQFEQLKGWTEESGIRWGLNEADAERFELSQMPQNTWLFGLRRMLLGYAMDEDRLFGEVLPYTEIEGMDAELLGRLAAFVDVLDDFIQQARQSHSIGQWQALLGTLLERLYLPDEQSEPLLALIYQQIERLRLQAAQAGFEGELSQAVIADYFSQALNNQRSGQRFLAGQVNFCTLMPMRSIPFTMVCLLGMNDGVYPRSLAPMGFDLMAEDNRKGDRSRRDDDRYLFLEALLSAQQKLYISYVGMSQQDNSPKVPSVLLTELLDYIGQGFVPEGHQQEDADTSYRSTQSRLTRTHPLTPYSPRYFSVEPPGSYAREWLSVLQGGTPVTEAVVLDLPEEWQAGQELELAELQRFLRLPCGYFFQRRLKVWLELESLKPDIDEPFSLDNLDSYRLRDTLLDARLRKLPEKEQAARLLASGSLPSGAFGELVLEENQGRINQLADRLEPLLTRADKDVEVRLGFDQWLLTGWLKGRYQGRLIRYRPGRLNAGFLLCQWLEHLCLCAVEPAESWLFGLNDGRKFLPLEPDHARQRLADLLALLEEGMRAPLPFFPNTALAWAELALDEQGQLQDDMQDKALLQARKVFDGDYLFSGEAENVYIARSFPEFELNRDDWQLLARRIFGPLLSHMETLDHE